MKTTYKYIASAALSGLFGLLISFSASAQHGGHGGGGGFHGVGVERLLRVRRYFVFATTPVICIATRAGEAHLKVLAGHIHSDEITRTAIRDERLPQRRRGLLGDRGSLEAPERQELALVRLGDEYALLAAPDAIALGLLAEVDPAIGVCVALHGHS